MHQMQLQHWQTSLAQQHAQLALQQRHHIKNPWLHANKPVLSSTLPVLSYMLNQPPAGPSPLANPYLGYIMPTGAGFPLTSSMNAGLPFPPPEEGRGKEGKDKPTTPRKASARHSQRPKALKLLCPEPGCTKRFKTKEGLRLHNCNYHLIDKRWKCTSEGCNRQYVRRSDLCAHIKRNHSKEKVYVCKVCANKFTCSYELRRHVGACHAEESKRDPSLYLPDALNEYGKRVIDAQRAQTKRLMRQAELYKNEAARNAKERESKSPPCDVSGASICGADTPDE